LRRITHFILLISLLAASVSPARGQLRGDLQASLQKAGSDSQKIVAYNHLLDYYKYVNMDSAIFYAEQGLQYAISKKYMMGQGIMISQLGMLDEGQGRSNVARQRILYALQIFREQNYLQGMAAMDNSLGSIEATKGNFEIAIRYFETALKLHEQISDDEGLLVSYTNLGSLYLQHGDTANAAKYLNMGMQVSKSIPIGPATINLNNYMGMLCATRGDKAGALQYFRNDVELSNKPALINVHVESLLFLGSFYHDLDSTERARQCLQDGLKIARANDLPEQEAKLLLELAGLLKNSDPGKAMNYLEDAMQVCYNLHNRSLLVRLYKQMGEIYEHEGMYKDALSAYKTRDAIMDSFAQANRSKEVASIGATYELKKSNDKLRNMEATSKRKDRERDLIILSSVFTAIVALIIVFLYLKARSLNKRLAAHEKDLNDLNNTKNKLFSIIGHDLRWPVARIPQVLAICDDPSISPSEREYMMESLKEHTNAIVETLDKLLYWGQSLIKGVNLKQEYFAPAKYVREAIELKKISADDKCITVTDNVPPDMKVYADSTHFDFIIRNLLGNAIKFTGYKGTVEINADVQMRPGYVVFSVKDNGLGIDKERLAKIFEPFNSKDGTASEKGTGIGLMLCKEFALRNSGDIWVESEPQKGATFYYSVKKDAPRG